METFDRGLRKDVHFDHQGVQVMHALDSFVIINAL
jgi:hypothetical protein